MTDYGRKILYYNHLQLKQMIVSANQMPPV